MKYRKLGITNLDVSVICLGTMTFGEQNSESDAFHQMDYAYEKGINFFDTAEMYPVYPKKETSGKTEEIIGNWFIDYILSWKFLTDRTIRAEIIGG